MTALVGVFGAGAATDSTVAAEMLGAMRNRASGTPEMICSANSRIAAARHEWEGELSGWSGPLLAENEDWVVAADATLYYQPDLRRRFPRASPGRDTIRFLLDALDQWGPGFARHLEGDYAIIVWEKKRGRVLLARDFSARRNLVYAVPTGGKVAVVASSPVAVVRHPDVSADYDPVFVAAAAAGLTGHGSRTAYREVSFVLGGTTLSIEEGRVTEVARWSPPPFGTGWEEDLSDRAAEELRHLLQEATTERLDADGPTTVWLSGGWDSTSVFASGKAVLSRLGDESRLLLPISMTYPADDRGNEDEHIRAVAQRWNTPVRWVNADDIPLIADGERRAALRDDPFAHPFESMLRALSQLTRELGSRVALDGFGGDHLFHVASSTVVADHFFHGRWAQLWRDRRMWPRPRQFARAFLLPNFSNGFRDWIGTVRGVPLAGDWERVLPRWIVGSPALSAQLAPEFDPVLGESPAQYESRMIVCSSFVSRAVAWNYAFGLDEGVHIRAPMFDTRVIEWAAKRPLSDRGGGGEGKRMLRRAMKTLIPDSVLAPRAGKTGTPAGYFKRQFLASVRSETAMLFGSRSSTLSQMGILDTPALLSAADEYLRTGNHALGATLQSTLEAERWLVNHARRS